jgi:hypothetical protein
LVTSIEDTNAFDEIPNPRYAGPVAQLVQVRLPVNKTLDQRMEWVTMVLSGVVATIGNLSDRPLPQARSTVVAGVALSSPQSVIGLGCGHDQTGQDEDPTMIAETTPSEP